MPVAGDFARSCANKRSYASEGAARRTIRRMRWQQCWHADEATVYVCKYCHQFHIGSIEDADRARYRESRHIATKNRRR